MLLVSLVKTKFKSKISCKIHQQHINHINFGRASKLSTGKDGDFYPELIGLLQDMP